MTEHGDSFVTKFCLKCGGSRVLYAAKVVDASFIGGQHSFVTLSLSLSLFCACNKIYNIITVTKGFVTP